MKSFTSTWAKENETSISTAVTAAQMSWVFPSLSFWNKTEHLSGHRKPDHGNIRRIQKKRATIRKRSWPSWKPGPGHKKGQLNNQLTSSTVFSVIWNQ
jgi:hypothetical protein